MKPIAGLIQNSKLRFHVMKDAAEIEVKKKTRSIARKAKEPVKSVAGAKKTTILIVESNSGRRRMYNRIFRGEDGKLYAIQGFNTKAKKWPIITKRVFDGESRVCNERFIKEILNEYYTEAIVSE